MNRSLVLNSDSLDNLFSNQKRQKVVQRGRGGNDAVDDLLAALSNKTDPTLEELGKQNRTYPFEQHVTEPTSGEFERHNATVFNQQTSDGTLSDVLNQLAKSKNQINNQATNQVESATSPAGSEIMRSVNPTDDVSRTVYHIIFDSDFGMRNKLNQHNSEVFGKLRNTVGNDKVPVLFELAEAVSVAERLIDQTVRLGTIGDKKFPVFGAIVLGLKLDNISVKNSSADSGTGKRDYGLLNGDNSDLVIYNIKNNRRGLLSRNALEKAVLVNATYVKKLDTPANIGFYLHNNNPNLSGNDVKLLKELYDANGKQVVYSENQSGGNNDAQYKLAYMQEKSRYLQLKEIAKQRGLIN